jgi:DNA-directed RNA polymerase specialized sigma24 family protein
MLLQLYIDGLSYAEMAEVMEMNVNSVGKTLSRAIKKVSVLLKGEKVNDLS